MKFFSIQILCMFWLTFLTTIFSQDNFKKIYLSPSSSNFAYPQSIFIDSKSGHIWITDFDNNRVLRFDVSTLTTIDEFQDSFAPSNYFLSQNYPNPFNPSTRIDFFLEEPSLVTLKIFDVLGREVELLISGNLSGGKHSIVWNAVNLPSGFYVCKLNANGKSFIKKMVLLK